MYSDTCKIRLAVKFQRLSIGQSPWANRWVIKDIITNIYLSTEGFFAAGECQEESLHQRFALRPRKGCDQRVCEYE